MPHMSGGLESSTVAPERLGDIRLVAPDSFGRNPYGLGQIFLKQAAPGPEVLEPAPEGIPGIQEVVGVALGLGEYLGQPALERRDDPAEYPGLQDPVGVTLYPADRAVAETRGFAELLDREAQAPAEVAQACSERGLRWIKQKKAA